MRLAQSEPMAGKIKKPINVGNKTVNRGITSNSFDLLPLRKTFQSPLYK
jgi:hypothetical protein